jgi:hypothetical protein
VASYLSLIQNENSMKKVYSTEILANAWNIKNVLEQHDIEAVIKNENLFSVSGEVPFLECLPQIWVKHLDFVRAKQIIADLGSSSEEVGPDWVCASCGEPNLSNYAVCWSCESSHENAHENDLTNQ